MELEQEAGEKFLVEPGGRRRKKSQVRAKETSASRGSELFTCAGRKVPSLIAKGKKFKRKEIKTGLYIRAAKKGERGWGCQPVEGESGGLKGAGADLRKAKRKSREESLRGRKIVSPVKRGKARRATTYGDDTKPPLQTSLNVGKKHSEQPLQHGRQ